jgi:hypothetical protein
MQVKTRSADSRQSIEARLRLCTMYIELKKLVTRIPGVMAQIEVMYQLVLALCCLKCSEACVLELVS